MTDIEPGLPAKIDDLKELELLRLQKLAGNISEEQFNQTFLTQLKDSQMGWRATMGGGLVGMATARQSEMVEKLSPDQRLEAMKIEGSTSYFGPKFFDKSLAKNIVDIRREYDAESGNQEKPLTLGQIRSYRVAIHSMVGMLDALPKDRQDAVQDYRAQ